MIHLDDDDIEMDPPTFAELVGPILETARVELHGEVPSKVEMASRAHVLARLQDGRSDRRSRAVPWSFAAIAAVVAIAAGVLFWMRPAPPLNFSIDGHPVAVAVGGAPITARGHDSEIAFDDGSRIAFRDGASGRIAEVTSSGARVVVAEGRAHFDVWHRPNTSWSVEAGRYVVRVTGTAFDVEWNPARGALRVTMERGNVVVEGAGVSVPLGAGQVLEVEGGGAPSVRAVADSATTTPTSVAAPSAPASVASLAPTLPTIDSGSAASQAPANDGAASARPDATGSFASTPHETWAQRVNRGDYRGVLDEASSKGMPQVLAGSPLDDLGALAEAARYEGQPDTARSVLEAIRTRFPGSAAAHTASFLLGRIAEDKDGAPAKAIDLYDDYLATGGPFASEALGRKMIAVNRASGSKAAEAIAREYLASYPTGSYAGAARRILGDP
jgi:hypothetical protein